MPSVSTKQSNLMAAACHDKKFARKSGVPAKVACEFNQADKGKGIIGKKPGEKGYKPLVRKKK